MKRIELFICMLFLSLLSMGQAYPSLDLSENPDTIKVDGASGYFELRYRTQTELDKQLVITQLNSFLEQQSWTWVRVIEMVPTSSFTGILVVRVEENTTGEPRWCVFLSLLTGKPHFVYQYGPGAIPRIYSVSGNATIYPGKRTFVTLSGLEQGVTYDLYRGTVLQVSLPGTGSPLKFLVTTDGNYTIKATRGDVSRNMNGSARVSYYGVLEEKIVVSASPRVMLSKDGETKMIPFSLVSDYPQGRAELEEITRSVLAGECVTWDSTFVLGFVIPASPIEGQVVIGCGPNCSDTTKQSFFVVNVVDRILIQASQAPGGILEVYNLSGGGEIAEGTTGTVALSGQQPFVDYKLYCNDVLVERSSISNQRFSGLRTYGRYRVKALKDGREAWMNGVVGIWPKITRSVVGGGGTIVNSQPVSITLPESQSTLTYRLLKGGTVVASRAGTGGVLSFSVSETGTYTMEAGLQDYFVPMTGSVTVDRDNGIHYTSTEHHVVETIYLDPTTSGEGARTINNVTYLDGFGRKLQEIQVNASPGNTSDIVQVYRYGVQGRVEMDHVPYALAGNHGGFVRDALSSSRWNMFGESEAGYMYTLTGYDNSPLDRVVKRTGPGKNWHVNGKGVTTTYGFNGSNEVRLYRVSGDGSLVLSGYYASGSLQKVTVTDEDGKRVETYTDNQDRAVLVVNVESDDNRLETYSVHDDRGLLRYVLSPEASARVGTTSTRFSEVIRLFGYYHEYDRFGRLILKQLPGCDPVYLVYDNRDRLVMSQDGKQRAENADKWSYSLYDGQNRVIETGEVVLTGTGRSHRDLQDSASGSDNYVPAGNRSPLQYTLYDNYIATTRVPVLAFQPTTGYAAGYHELVTGLVTSVRTRVLGSSPEQWLTTTTYYDDRCRVIQTVSDNVEGFTSRVDARYDFVGNVVGQRESHRVSASRTDVLEVENSYDDRGRLLSSTTRLNGGNPATVEYTYDAVGRLVGKTRGTVTETLAYNARGWLTSKESVPFKMKLRYEIPEGGGVACWNGNISEWEWQQGSNVALMYGFAYDGVNRLLETTQKQKSGTAWSTLSGSYLERGLSYDRNGNLKTLQRTAGGSLVDNLVYTCTGNQLTGLTENVASTLAGDVYSRGGSASGTYAYDKNGNMINDSRRALDFGYNVLNLLSEVKTTGGVLKAKYVYLADGTRSRVRDNGGVNGFDYLGSLTYRKSGTGLQLESANFGDGVIRPGDTDGGQMEVDYFLTDHLGSVRVIVDGTGKALERNDYYPFGARYARSDYPQLAVNRYKYNGKEEQVTGDLGFLDYGARMYDSGLGRWFGMDKLSEEYKLLSPYNYTSNNPVNIVDPDGNYMDWFMNELTGDIYYNSTYKKGDETKIDGVGWTWLGPNGMFSNKKYTGIVSDVFEIWNSGLAFKMEMNFFKSDKFGFYGVESGEALFKGENAIKFMSSYGYKLRPKIYNYYDDISIDFHPEAEGQVQIPRDNSYIEKIFTYQYVHESRGLLKSRIMKTYWTSLDGPNYIGFSPVYTMRERSLTLRQDFYFKGGNSKAVNFIQKVIPWQFLYEQVLEKLINKKKK